MKTPFLKTTFLILFAGASIVSCKKTDEENTPISGKPDIRDSTYIYSQSLYLWYENLPTLRAFNPTNFADADAVIEKVRTYSPLGTDGKNLDRWSFVATKQEWENVVSGKSSDFGMRYRYPSQSENLRVSFVYANSPAGRAGVQRGWKINKIGSVAATYANIDAINSTLGQSSLAFEFEKPDGSKVTSNFTATEYQQNTVVSKQVFSLSNRKVGYVMFSTFFGTAVSELTAAFDDFAAQGVDGVIVDLRYNGGGSVPIAESFMNLLANQTAKGKLMYKYVHNKNYVKYDKSTNFVNSAVKLPGMKDLVFITTRNSASASELMINSLKPYFPNMKIVGSNSEGKPVGMYTIPVMDYYVAPIAFKTVNANNEADYYGGFKPDKVQFDDVYNNFGENEACVKDALTFMRTGALPVRTADSNARLAEETLIENKQPLDKKDVRGLFDARNIKLQ